MSKENSTIVIGAGISGSCTAYHLNKAGWNVTVIDEKKEDDIQIYSNPAVCVYPKIMLNDPTFNKFMYLSTEYVWSLIKEIDLKEEHTLKVGAIHLYDTKDGTARYAKLIKNTSFTVDDVELINQEIIKKHFGIIDNVGFHFKKGGWINPKAICKNLIADKNIKKIFYSKIISVERDKGYWTILTDNKKKLMAKNIIFCSAGNLKNYKYFNALKFHEYRGQVNWLSNKKNRHKEVLSNDGYVIPDVNEKIIFGSSYEKNNFNADSSQTDTVNNINKLKKLIPNLKYSPLKDEIDSWVGQRAASFDKKPFVGRVLRTRDSLISPIKYSTEDLDWYEGLFINACYGSRGFSFAPLASLSLAKFITGNLNDDDKFILNYLNPERQYFKKQGIKKKGVKFN
jgi:tRNA 5-methylaminomethyl-2-thiouridine biosynthesis bifunctional protein